MDEREVWVAVKEFPAYEISNLGRVRRMGRIVRGWDNGAGYLQVNLWSEGKRRVRTIHALVAEGFLPPKPTPKHEIAHGDGNRANCREDNLRWATRAENHADKLLHGTSNRGERQGLSRLTAENVHAILAMKKQGVSQARMARAFNVHPATVGAVLRGVSWSWLTGISRHG